MKAPMNTREVESSQWPAALDQFSRLHRGQPVLVRSAGLEFGVQANAKNLPLLGVTAERQGDGGTEIQVMVGTSLDTLVTHVVAHPRTVRVAEWNDSVSAVLQIEAEDGTVTLVEAGPERQLLPPGYIVDDIEHAPRKGH